MSGNEWIEAFGMVFARICPKEVVDVDHPLEMAKHICNKMDKIETHLDIIRIAVSKLQEL